MIKRRYFYVFGLFILFFQFCTGQNMQEGYNYLDNGEYDKAEQYFSIMVTKYPNNKTASICYARAIGLNGKPKQAFDILLNLKQKYPEDLEVKLNYGECLLWNTMYSKAQPFYYELVREHPNNFSVNLGYANTLNNLKEYEKAFHYIQKALTIEPQNQGAKTSLKYIRLAWANELIKFVSYQQALKLLEKNLEDFPNDIETMISKINLIAIMETTDNALAYYKSLEVTTHHKIYSNYGLAIVLHKLEKNKEALIHAEKAMNIALTTKNNLLIRATNERYTYALIWNKKFKQARAKINELTITYGHTNWVAILKATLETYRGFYYRSIQEYNYVLQTDTLSFDALLGNANANFGYGDHQETYRLLGILNKLTPNQPDAIKLKNKVNLTYTPLVKESIGYSFDNGNNRAFYTTTNIETPLSTQISLLGNYNYRHTKNSITNNNANSHTAMAGLTYKIAPTIKLGALGGIASVNSFTNNYTTLLAKTYVAFNPYPLQNAELGYYRDLQNFNADLMSLNISGNHFYINYNLYTNLKLGWYTQYDFTNQSDDNTRNLLFTSLYYNFTQKPLLKAGVNYQYMSFKNERPLVYFSPKEFNAGEVFVTFLSDQKTIEPNHFFGELTAASGLQFIDTTDKQFTYRFKGDYGYKFSDYASIGIYGLHTNIASATASGFIYSEFGIKLNWLFLKKPIFTP